MKLLRELLSWDCLLHAIFGAGGAFALAFGPPWWVAIVAVTAFGFGREIQQAWDDRDGDRWPWQWSQHRWAEAIAWVPGAAVGAVIHAVII